MLKFDLINYFDSSAMFGRVSNENAETSRDAKVGQASSAIVGREGRRAVEGGAQTLGAEWKTAKQIYSVQSNGEATKQKVLTWRKAVEFAALTVAGVAITFFTARKLYLGIGDSEEPSSVSYGNNPTGSKNPPETALERLDKLLVGLSVSYGNNPTGSKNPPETALEQLDELLVGLYESLGQCPVPPQNWNMPNSSD